MTGYRRIPQERARRWIGPWIQRMVGAAWTLALTTFLIIKWAPTVGAAINHPPDLTELTLEQLMTIEITSASKKEEPLWDSAAAVFVITGEDIRRAGMKSIPEALRLAPGVEVAQFGANRWAISARGFNATFSNKLLVLIDGRSVYTPLFAGVFWDAQDTLLEDIDRIEVVRGPGGTLWGANAVNGVINVITKQAKATQGGYIEVGGGSEERGFVGTRYGGRVGENLFYRGYFKYANRDNLVSATGREGIDDWRTYRGGFRLDWEPSTRDTVTVQGDLYKGDFGQTLTVPSLLPPFSAALDSRDDFAGGNLLTRWRHRTADRRETSLQFYYDRTHRDELLFGETRDTVDLEFQYRFPVGTRHDLMWGVGTRVTIDDLDDIDSPSLAFTPRRRTDHLVSGFIQDQVTLMPDRLTLTLGSKFEHNSYSGFEVQPNARLVYSPNTWNRVWAAVSRAVRTPARFERDVRNNTAAFPGSVGPIDATMLVQTSGNSDFTSEELLAFELGYRVQPVEWLSVDLAGFYTIYDNLRTAEPGTPIPALGASPPYIVLPFRFDNRMSGNTYGVEIASTWQPLSVWRLHLNYSYLKIELHPDRTSVEPIADERRSPRHQVQVRSLLDLPWHLQLDAAAFFVDRLPNLVPSVPSYVRLDLRLGWRPTPAFDLSLVGQNLLDNRHPEWGSIFGVPVKPLEVQRSAYVQASWRF
ncbi:TonB-dependent outer membrane receptor for cobalamin and Fe transport [Candidatus Methylomirabilis lanthanidiphila]|uniref:TonB-dependent outer membrane receptor for cobalamin and Fe transport n=1 Tax=Candidatus Methylomirabilis lanthanidiphila TaxID=2211376 RepID=A0A564ZI55_9BACT|nr:TonB-dependent receptor [Candidatus Methylomirabilis lanthanidiphila]VUZ85030.1 TonB-dependent outer membrane receptor for cobalamin and Fe transport [Candidatus Methylomirabilis lanthanidiphila]